MRTIRYPAVGVLLVAALLCVACGVQVTRTPEPAGRAMPSWYKNVDPTPDGENMYFIGYHEGALRFDQAISLATRNAKNEAAAYLGTEIIQKTESLMEQSGTNWADVYAEQGDFAGQTSGGPVSRAPEDWVREQLKTLVNESINMARRSDQYVEKVVVRKGRSRRTRYDAGVLVEYPIAEIERLRSLEALEMKDKEVVSDYAKRAERLWAAGDKDDAIEMMRKARRRFPQDADIAMRLAQYLEDVGQNDEAVRIYSTVENMGGEGAALASAKVASHKNAGLANYLNLLERHNVSGSDLVDVLTWAADGQTNRAREMARENVKANADNPAMLYVWHIMAQVDEGESQSMAARYDVQKSGKAVSDTRAQWQNATDAEPAVATLLSMVQQDVGASESVSEMKKIQKQFPDATFSPEIGDMAALALGSRQDKSSQDLAEWLNRAP